MKKIITSIILSCVLCFPMLVDAREETFTDADGTKTCEITTNYYFMLEEPSSYDAEGEITNGIWTNQTNYNALYDDTIGEGIYSEELIYSESKLESNKYHTRLFAALDNYDSNGSAEYKYSSDVYYYLQNSFESATDSGDLPFFADRYLNASSSSAKTSFKNSVANSYFYLTSKSNSTSMSCDDCIYVKRTTSNGQVKLNVIKNYSIAAARLNDTSKVFYNEPWLNVDDKYSVVFIPALYKVEHYDPDDCVVEDDEPTTSTYKVIYHSNYGNDETKSFTETVGTKHIIQDNEWFERSGYKFLGWSSSPTSTDTNFYGVGVKVSSNTNLYAVWQKIDDSVPTYKVNYHKNAGDNVVNSDDIKQGEDYKIKTGDMYSREGYKFLGWSTDKDATKADTKYNPDSIITVDKNLDLYAVWLNTGSGKVEEDSPKTGLGYSVGLIGTILAGTGAGVVYFKKRNKFENI